MDLMRELLEQRSWKWLRGVILACGRALCERDTSLIWPSMVLRCDRSLRDDSFEKGRKLRRDCAFAVFGCRVMKAVPLWGARLSTLCFFYLLEKFGFGLKRFWVELAREDVLTFL